jgi:hypothetical protein
MSNDPDGRADPLPFWYRNAHPEKALALGVVRRGLRDANGRSINHETPPTVEWPHLAAWMVRAGWPLGWLRAAAEGAPHMGEVPDPEADRPGGIGEMFDSPYPDNLILHARFLREETPDDRILRKLGLPGGTIARWDDNGWV